MRRLARHILSGLALLSLVLTAYAALAAAFAAREGGPHLRGWDVFQPLEPPRRFTAAETNAYRPPAPTFNFAGFRVQRGFRAEYTIQHGRVYTVPFWFLAVVFALPPAAWLRARRREWLRGQQLRMWRTGVCPICGTTCARPRAAARSAGPRHEKPATLNHQPDRNLLECP